MPLTPPPAPWSDGVVELRAAHERDLALVERAAGQSEIADRFGLSRLRARGYLDAYLAGGREGTSAALSICSGSEEAVGQILLELRDAGRADVGYWLLREGRGRGLATRGLRLAAGWALAQPEVARLQLRTTPDNVPSQRVAERCGFSREGVLRSYGETVDGRRVDAVFYSLLRDEA